MHPLARLTFPADVAVSVVTTPSGFAALESEWNALSALCGDLVFLRHEFLQVFMNNFSPRGRRRVLLARDYNGKLVGALPLLLERGSLWGVPMWKWVAAANSHSCRFDLLAAPGFEEMVAQAFLGTLRRVGGWDVLLLTDVPEGGSAFKLYEAARRLGHPVGAWESLRSPFVPLPKDFQSFQAGLSSKFKANCRRRRRRLEELGAVQWEKFVGGQLLDARLCEGLALEQSGWKGRQGTAMAQHSATRGFYAELAHVAAQKGWLEFHFLRLTGRAVAFHYALRYGGKYLLLKPGYDEAFGECSPGQLLMEQVFQSCIAEGMTELDFLGPDMVWKRDWTQRVRPHFWLYIFRDGALGRALCAAKFSVWPKLKQGVARWRR